MLDSMRANSEEQRSRILRRARRAFSNFKTEFVDERRHVVRRSFDCCLCLFLSAAADVNQIVAFAVCRHFDCGPDPVGHERTHREHLVSSAIRIDIGGADEKVRFR